MPATEAAISISSMSVGNTDWKEYIAFPVHAILGEQVRPSDIGEVACHHRSIAEKLGCNGQFGCFIEVENWSFNEAKARVFHIQSDGQLDSFIMDVEITGETLNSVMVGSSSWEKEKAQTNDSFITK